MHQNRKGRKHKMNKLLGFVATVLLMSSPLFSQQSNTNAQKSHTTHVQARGCVRPGKEEGCFVLHDIKRHHYYDLSFDTTPGKPDLYTHISFEGIGYAHDAHCSQGRPVHVSSWKTLPGECTRPASSKTKAE
jgi:hypothetical protein